MDYFYESYVNFEPEDIPKTKDDVWILAKKYSAIQGEFLFKCVEYKIN